MERRAGEAERYERQMEINNQTWTREPKRKLLISYLSEVINNSTAQHSSSKIEKLLSINQRQKLFVSVVKN